MNRKSIGNSAVIRRMFFRLAEATLQPALTVLLNLNRSGLRRARTRSQPLAWRFAQLAALLR